MGLSIAKLLHHSGAKVSSTPHPSPRPRANSCHRSTHPTPSAARSCITSRGKSLPQVRGITRSQVGILLNKIIYIPKPLTHSLHHARHPDVAAWRQGRPMRAQHGPNVTTGVRGVQRLLSECRAAASGRHISPESARCQWRPADALGLAGVQRRSLAGAARPWR